MPRRSLTIEQVLTLLPETAPRIEVLTVDVSPSELQTQPEPGEWSAKEVLAHLRACADVWGGCIETMLAEDHQTIRAVNPTTWAERTGYADQDFEASLRAFATQRADLLGVLRGLGPGDWSRAAVITGAGHPLERTVLDYASRMARHERTHLKQVASVVRQVGTA